MAASGCSRSGAVPAMTHVRSNAAVHIQIVPMKTTLQRAEIFARFRAKNGGAWSPVPEGDLATSIEPMRGHLLRASRSDAEGSPVSVDGGTAEARAAAFVTKNAEFFALSHLDLLGLEFRARALPGGRIAVRVEGRLPMPGYELFPSVESVVDIALFFGQDGEIREIVNASRMHPLLSIDTRPGLDDDDPRLVRKLVGRRLFAVFADPSRPAAPVRELKRVVLGVVEESDIGRKRLTILVTPGALGAWTSYRLAYGVDVAKVYDLYGAAPQPVFFRWFVDCDTGDVVEEPIAPVILQGMSETP